MLKQVRSLERTLLRIGKAIKINESRCVRLRHKWSKCQTCITNCPTGAIGVGRIGGTIWINWENCIECGICCNVCETGVYSLKNSSNKDLLDRCKRAIEDKKLQIRCKKVNEKSSTPEVDFNCLGIINPAYIFGMIAYGAKTIHFRYANCSDCEAKHGDVLVSRAINAAQSIFKAFYPTKEVKITSGKHPGNFTIPPEDSKDEKKVTDEEKAMSRRELFKYFKKQTQFTMVKTMDVFWDWDTDKKPTARRRIDYSSLLPVKRRLMLVSLQALGEPDGNLFDTSDNALITDIEIDKDKCDVCGICYKFCPTGALKEYTTTNEKGDIVKAGFNFTPAYCVKCDLCLVACFQKAIKYKTLIDIKHFAEGRERALMRTPGDIKAEE